MSTLPLYAVILAGGSGTRLWPLARAARPKQFLPLFGGRSLFQRTVARAAAVAGRGRVVVVAGRPHGRFVRAQAPGIPANRIILEGEGRNTAASVALAARWARARHGDAILAVMPSDHWIAPRDGFLRTLRAAIDAVRREDVMALVGIPARSVETGFGYILPGAPGARSGVAPVASFVEKPGEAAARRMVRSQRWLWNSGLFVWRASTILGALAAHAPRLARAAAEAGMRPGRQGWAVPASAMRRIPSEPIDRAVLEKTDRLVVARAGFSWSDLGNWDAIARLMADEPWGASIRGAVLAVGTERCEAVNPGGVTAFVGVEDLVVVRDGSTVLVCRRDAVQRVRELGGGLRGRQARHA